MRIYIKSPERTLRLRIPTRLALNNLTAQIISKQVKKHVEEPGSKYSSIDFRRLFRTIHQIRRKNHGWNLVEIESADGEIIKIKL